MKGKNIGAVSLNIERKKLASSSMALQNFSK
jgi:hypothetical protein